MSKHVNKAEPDQITPGENLEQIEFVAREAVKDCIRYLRPLMIMYCIIEICMMLHWEFCAQGDWADLVSRSYLLCYIAMFFVSGGMFYLADWVNKDLGRRWTYLSRINPLLMVFFMLWSLVVTVLDAFYLQNFSLLPFVTMNIASVIVIFIPGRISLYIQGLGCVSVIVMILRSDRSDRIPLLINFCIYSLIFLTLLYGLNHLRSRLYASLYQTMKDVETQRDLNERLEYISQRDALTGLNNRHLLRDRFEHYPGHYLNVCLCDIDKFKHFNDDFGHDVGDRILRIFSDGLIRVFGDHNCYRFGGDEFLIITEGSLEEFCGKMGVLKRIIKEAGSEEWSSGLSYSAGAVSGYCPSTVVLREMLKIADSNMYEAKREQNSELVSTRL